MRGRVGGASDEVLVALAWGVFAALFGLLYAVVARAMAWSAGALRVYGDARTALRSQIPMLALMVCYTMSSLWILSQPIVKVRGHPA